MAIQLRELRGPNTPLPLTTGFVKAVNVSLPEPAPPDLRTVCTEANSILDQTSAYITGLRAMLIDKVRGMENHTERARLSTAIHIGSTALNSAYQVSTRGFVSDSVEVGDEVWARLVDGAYLWNGKNCFMPTALRAGIFAVQVKRGSDFGDDAARHEGAVDSIFIPPGVNVFYGMKMHKNGMVVMPLRAPFAVDEEQPKPLILSNFTQGRSRAGFNTRCDDVLGVPVEGTATIAEAKISLVLKLCGVLAAEPFPKHPLQGRIPLPEL